MGAFNEAIRRQFGALAGAIQQQEEAVIIGDGRKVLRRPRPIDPPLPADCESCGTVLEDLNWRRVFRQTVQ